MKRFSLAALVLMIAACLVATTDAASWPQWRGPERNGVSTETGLLDQWPAEGPKLLWQRNELGGGYSTPAVVGNRLYVLGSSDAENEFIQALDVANRGQELWKK